MKLKTILGATIACILVLSACGSTSANYIMATGGTSGTYYPYGGAMCQIINENVENMSITVQSTGASVENLKLLDANEAELAIVQNDILDYAYNGTEMFPDGKLENIQVIASLYPEVIQIVVSADSDIFTVEDLKGKKISVGAPGSGTEANARQILEVAGLSYDDVDESFLSFAESADSFKDKHIDGCFVTAGVPNAAIQDIAAQNKIRLVSLSDAQITDLIDKYPFYSRNTIPADTYTNQSEAAEAVAIRATLAVNKDLSEDSVYEIVKTLFDNQPELATSHAKGEELSLDSVLEGISIPIHPGADKYFKEIGVN